MFLLQVIAALQGKQGKKEINKHNKRIRFDYTFKNKQARYQRRNFEKPFKPTWGELGRHLLRVIYLSYLRLITVVQAGQLFYTDAQKRAEAFLRWEQLRFRCGFSPERSQTWDLLVHL